MKGKLVLYILVACVVLAGLIWIAFKRRSEDYTPKPVIFLTQQQTSDFIRNDADGYGLSLNQTNLEGLGVFNHQDLIEKWSTSAMAWKPEEIQKLRDAALIADYHINTHLKGDTKRQMSEIEWKFAKTMSPYLCDGLPHTREDVIFLTDKAVALSDLRSLARLLIHEKTHVWQRKYPEAMNAWMDKQGFRRVKNVLEDPLQRRNPDVDDWIYENSEGQMLGVQFNSTTPFSLSDVKYQLQLDHPFEQFASKMEKMVKG